MSDTSSLFPLFGDPCPFCLLPAKDGHEGGQEKKCVYIYKINIFLFLTFKAQGRILKVMQLYEPSISRSLRRE